uniref:Glycoside hydrolase family 57 n=1 Tax=Geobacter sp. (strain M21) TaxID=443144 RepID=C6E8R1_GEOSM
MEQAKERFVCIHGHFYQPPRENPWLEAVEIQDSAFPYHDWNERITAECYAANSASRILDGDQRVMDITSNYAKINFNFGPTVLSWMAFAAPKIYQAILDADKLSMKWRSGHGSAIAQVFNHMIMPLANSRDKRTQIVWGIKDFEQRFQRFPEGMWLAETAVDLESLDLLAEYGIKYTILAPHQAAGYRELGAEEWTETEIDPTRAYLCRLPSGREISLFFYDGPISRAVAFENLLDSGEALANRLVGGFTEDRDWEQLMHIATDGETYGHHQKFGDMALAAALNHIEQNNLARLTNYGEYLELCPPTMEAKIHERTSWSCAHGVERWNSDCGCSGGTPGWNQQWRGPLRASLDWLRDRLAQGFSRKGAELLKDPWQARDAYIEVILNREMEQAESFLAQHAKKDLDADEKIAALKLLEMQRHAMLMYTSCGWFFDELSGLETVQVIDYASRALQLSDGIVEHGVEKAFLDRLKEAKSNIPAHQDGLWIYQNFVLPIRLDLVKVGAHYAFSSLYEEYEDHSQIYCYAIAKEEYGKISTPDAVIAMGRIHVASEITEENTCLTFCVMRLGSHDFKGGVIESCDGEAYAAMREEMSASFDKGLYTELVTLMDKHFGTHSFSLLNLFSDEQRKIINIIINQNMEESISSYQDMFERSRPLMEFVKDTRVPVPHIFLAAAEPALNQALKKAMSEEEIDEDAVRRIIGQIKKWQVGIDGGDTEYFMRRHMESMSAQLMEDPGDAKLMGRMLKYMNLLNEIPINLVLWQMQNDYYILAKTVYPDYAAKAAKGEEGAAAWTEAFQKLGETFRFNLGAVLPQG